VAKNITMKKKLVVLTGAGISAESGIKLSWGDGLWEGHNVLDVATPEGWYKNRLWSWLLQSKTKTIERSRPNLGHLILAEFDFEVYIITQNVDDLHERAKF
jgi:NAD-dependent deacetylase